MPAFFDAIAKARNLPNVVELKLLDGDAESFRAMMSALGARAAAQDVRTHAAVSQRRSRAQTLGLDGKEAAAGLEQAVGTRCGRCRERAHCGRRARRVRNFPQTGIDKLEGRERHGAAVERERRCVRAPLDRRAGGARRRVGRAAARRRKADRRAGAAVLRHHGLHLENRIRCGVREVLSRARC